MSTVRKRNRAPNRFTVLDIVLDMYEHTLVVTRNPKIFTEKYADLTSQIESEARLIYHYCRVANEELDNRKPDEARQRLRLETKAIEECRNLKTDIMLASKVFHLRASKTIAWKDYVDIAMVRIKEWHSAEIKTYRR